MGGLERVWVGLTRLYCRYRPDLMSSSDRADSSSPANGAQLQPPLVLCSVAGTSRDTLIARLLQDYPAKFGSAIR